MRQILWLKKKYAKKFTYGDIEDKVSRVINIILSNETDDRIKENLINFGYNNIQMTQDYMYYYDLESNKILLNENEPLNFSSYSKHQ